MSDKIVSNLSASKPTPTRRLSPARLGVIVTVALVVVGIILIGMTSLSQAAPQAPGLNLTLTSVPAGQTTPGNAVALLPGAKVTYTVNLRNTSSQPATYGHIRDSLPPGMEILSVTPSETTRSGDLQSGYVLTWNLTGGLAGGASFEVVIGAQLATTDNILHALLTNQADATLGDGTGSNNSPSKYLYHFLNVNGQAAKSHTSLVSTTVNTRYQATAGEPVTMTVVFTIPQGTVVYNAVPRVLLQDGIRLTGASSAYMTLTNQASLDPQRKSGVNFTQVEFGPRTVTDTDSMARTLVYTLYGHLTQNYFLAAAPSAIARDTRLLIQPILRWCQTPGCSIDQTSTLYFYEDETDNTTASIVFVRPEIGSPTISLTYVRSDPQVIQGGDQVKFKIASQSQTPRPSAYNLVMTVILGPGMQYQPPASPAPDDWATLGDVTILTWTTPILTGTTPDNRWLPDREITARLLTPIVVGTQFTCTAQVRYETFGADVPDKGVYLSEVGHGTTNLGDLVYNIKTVTPNDNVTIGDMVSYTLSTKIGGGTILHHPNYTDTLPRGFHFVPDSFQVQGATTTTGPLAVAGPTQYNKVRESLAWYMADVDNRAASTPYVFTATYQAILTGVDVNGQPVYMGESKTNALDKYQDFRDKQGADNEAELHWRTDPADPDTDLFKPALKAQVKVAQPYLNASGGGLFTTTRRDPESHEIGSQDLTFDTVIRNNTKGTVNAYEVRVCDRLPDGVEVFNAPQLNAPASCPGATFTQRPQQGDTGDICWVINKVCPSSGTATDFVINYTLKVLPTALPGIKYANHAHIAEYSSLPGDPLYDRHYSEFRYVVDDQGEPILNQGEPIPLAMPLDQEAHFKVIGLAASKSTDQAATSPGALITYTLAYTDTGASDYTDLVITDTYDTYLDFVSADPAPIITDTAQHRLVWDVANVPSSGSQSIILIMQVNPVVPGTVMAVVNTMRWDSTVSNVAREQPLLTWVITTPFEAANPHVQLTGPMTSHADAEIVYTVAYSNDGTAARAMTLTLDYSPYLTFVDFTPGTPRLAQVADDVYVDSSVPSNGQSYTLSLRLRVNAPLPYTLDKISSQVDITSFGVPPQPDSWTTNLLRPILDVQKVGPPLPSSEGQAMQYTIRIQNNGTYTATGLILTDTWDAHSAYHPQNDPLGWTDHGDYATYAAPDLGIGQSSGPIYFNVTVTQRSVFYTNTVFVSSDQTSAQFDQAKVWQKTIATSKSVTPDPAFPGRVLTYTIHYTNTDAQGAVSNAVITDELPAGLSYLGHTLTGTGCQTDWQFEITGQTAVWHCVSMLADAHSELQVWGTVVAGEDTWLVNEVAASGDNLPVRTMDEPLRTRVARPWLGVIKLADTRPVATQDLITYTLVYSNYGTDPSYNTTIIDELPSPVSFVECSDGCSHSNNVVKWNVGTVPTNTQGQVEVVVRVIGSHGQRTNNADYTIESKRLTPAETRSGPPVLIDIRDPHLTLVKQAEPLVVPASNDPITYTIYYTNDGGGALHNVVITDDLADAPNGVLFSDASANCTSSSSGVGSVVVCTIGYLTQGQSGMVWIRVLNSAVVGAQIDNRAVGYADSHAQGLPVTSLSNETLVYYLNPGECIRVINPSFSLNPTQPQAGAAITFTGQVYTGTPPINYTWDFGDDGAGNGQTVHHTYSLSGTYTIVMTASNTCKIGGDDVIYQKSYSRTVAVPGTPDVAVAPPELSLNLVAGTTAERTLAISNTGSADLNWSLDVAGHAAWLSVTPVTGVLAAKAAVDLSVSFTAPLTVGTYTDTVVVSGDPDGAVNVPVVLNVQPACEELTGITIYGETSGQPGVYTFTTTYQPAAATTPTYLWDNNDTTARSVRLLGVGSYTLTVTANNACSTVTDTHTIVISPLPVADITMSPVSLTVTLDASQTQTKALTIGNQGTAALNWSLLVTPTATWLAVNPLNGDTPASESDAVVVTFNAPATAGDYTTTLQINSNDPDEARVNVPVRLTVRQVQPGFSIYLPAVLKNAP